MLLQLDTEQHLRVRVSACVHSGDAHAVVAALGQQADCVAEPGFSRLEKALQSETLLTLPEALLIELDARGEAFRFVQRIKENMLLRGIIIVMLAPVKNPAWQEQARVLRIHDYYERQYPVDDICERLAFLVKYKLIRPSLTELLAKKDDADPVVRIPFWKRAFDIAFSAGLLLGLSPILALTALAIRLESPGPVVYRSKRVGTGYRIFDFYKFRSMFRDADQRLSELAQHNQYSPEHGEDATFVKFRNDPRITRVGRIIRRTSVDELPQLFNILRGDMSIVGNRPLPLYEAELLTSNEWSWRFLAPSGLTGLWQISRRGRADMSERERKKLDNFYAQKYSLKLDLKILLKTLPAAFQRENV